MPAYDFRCTACSLVTEIVRPLTDDSPVPCPSCGADTKQVFHPVGVHFKGSGFHNTDNRKPNNPPAETKPVTEAPSCGGDGGCCSGCPASS